ncbi:divalent cation tolerance protein CutA [Nocardia donostiensis]|uniref:divalent cation tolerance protein CutA n=1 Tax=Nocardia donostiensis TaxID=1538463 RepID=UPI001C376038|nr:divalent cation tolerance protein CutA [Nocardia donostiensis]
MSSTAEVIRLQRSRLHISQGRLAELVGVSQRQIGRYESGEQSPSLTVSVRLAQALEVSLAELAGIPAPEIETPDVEGRQTEDDIVDVSITAGDAEWLAEFTRRLVRDRLAACGNIIAGVRSIYRWEGQVEDGSEALVVLHTRRSLVPAITERADTEHADKTPQVLAVPVVDAHPGYRQWVLDETRP